MEAAVQILYNLRIDWCKISEPIEPRYHKISLVSLESKSLSYVSIYVNETLTRKLQIHVLKLRRCHVL